MINFWTSGTGEVPTGNPEDAFIKEYGLIANNTKVLAKIVSAFTHEGMNRYNSTNEKFIQIIWEIKEGEYKGRNVKQKIQCFLGKPEGIDKSLNMLKLLMKLCDFKPSHTNEPTVQDLNQLEDKVLGIKIRQKYMTSEDGKDIEWNSIDEIHPIHGFESQQGELIEHKKTGYESALQRNSSIKRIDDFLDDDINF